MAQSLFDPGIFDPGASGGFFDTGVAQTTLLTETPITVNDHLVAFKLSQVFSDVVRRVLSTSVAIKRVLSTSITRSRTQP